MFRRRRPTTPSKDTNRERGGKVKRVHMREYIKQRRDSTASTAAFYDQHGFNARNKKPRTASFPPPPPLTFIRGGRSIEAAAAVVLDGWWRMKYTVLSLADCRK